MPISNELGSQILQALAARAQATGNGLTTTAATTPTPTATKAAEGVEAPKYDKSLTEFAGMKLVTLDRSIGMSDAAIDGISQSVKVLEQMRGLAKQATSTQTSSSARQSLVAQLAKASAQLDKLAKDTAFDGTKLADGTTKEIAVGFDTYIHSATLSDTSSSGLGLSGLDLASSAGATKAMQGIDAAMTKLGDKRVDLGRYRDRMVDHLSDAARSQQLTDVRDASQAKDLAAELRDTMGATSKTQLGIAALSTSNQATQAVLSLLR